MGVGKFRGHGGAPATAQIWLDIVTRNPGINEQNAMILYNQEIKRRHNERYRAKQTPKVTNPMPPPTPEEKRAGVRNRKRKQREREKLAKLALEQRAEREAALSHQLQTFESE